MYFAAQRSNAAAVLISVWRKAACKLRSALITFACTESVTVLRSALPFI